MPPKKRRETYKKAVNNHLKRLVTGVKFRPPPQPPTIKYAPWYPLVVATTLKMTAKKGDWTYIKSSSVITAMLEQLGLEEVKKTVAIKIESIRIWVPQVNIMNNIDVGVTYFGLLRNMSTATDPASPPIAQVQCTGTGTQSARCGFVYPESHQQAIINSSDPPIYLFAIQSNITTVADVHFHVFWSMPDATALPPPVPDLNVGVLTGRLGAHDPETSSCSYDYMDT